MWKKEKEKKERKVKGMKKEKKSKNQEFTPTTMEQILGDTGINKYGTMELKVYEEKLNDMNKSDLQTHALNLGVPPIDDRVRLQKNLVASFKRHVSGYRMPPQPKQKIGEKNLPKEVLKIMAEGR